jgi:hypothetical protein
MPFSSFQPRHCLVSKPCQLVTNSGFAQLGSDGIEYFEDNAPAPWRSGKCKPQQRPHLFRDTAIVAVKQEPVYFGTAGNVHLDDEIQVESEQPLSRILAAILCVAVKVEKVKEEAAPSLITDGV